MDHYASWKDPDKGTPQLRGGEIDMESLKFIPKMERSLVLCLMEMYINGVRTRKVRKIMEPLCGENISKSMVSRLCKELDHDIEAWKQQGSLEVPTPSFWRMPFTSGSDSDTR
jgi:putative transposase